METDAEPKNQDEFLLRFLEGEDYLQNPLLNADDFVSFCNKVGINTNETQLEYLEKEKLFYPILRIERPILEEDTVIFIGKDGKEMWRYARDKPIEGENVTGKGKVKYFHPCEFDDRSKENLLYLLQNKHLFDPRNRPFQFWKEFRGGQLHNGDEKVRSYYSNFQCHWLKRINDELTLTLNFAHIPIQHFQNSHIDRRLQDINNSMSILQKMRNEFEMKERVMLCLQSVYAPFGRSGSKSLTLHGNPTPWEKKRHSFQLNNVMICLGIESTDIANLYLEYCEEARKLLDVKWSDSYILQLWKDMDWRIKDGLEGKTRQGIEYLQWALILGRALSDHLGRHIFDIDEVRGFKADDLLKVDPTKLKYEDKQIVPNNHRAAINYEMFDGQENRSYYYHTYKRLYYLANGLGIDYQPRVMVFLEGETEEKAFQKFFEWRFGPPENHGIEFFTLNGVDNLFGNSTKVNNPSNPAFKKLLSNFTYLISYNLSKWQIIPFIVADDEGGNGGLAKALIDGILFSFGGKEKAMPNAWQFIWGKDDYNRPFGGKSFELANFSDAELVTVLGQYLPSGVAVCEHDIQALRNPSVGINKVLGGKYASNIRGATKVKIGEQLIEGFIQSFQPNDNNKVHKRPLLKVFDKIMKLSSLNHPPVHRIGEIQNKIEILRVLK